MIVNGEYTCEKCGETFDSNVAIAGHVRAHQTALSSDEILSELRRLAEEKGRAPMQPELDKETEFTAGAVRSHFGSWTEGLREIGLEPLDNSSSREEVLAELRSVAEVLGKSPARAEFNEHAALSGSTVAEYFGSYNQGLEAAGLAVTKSSKVPREEVIQAIQSLADDLGRPPTASEMDEQGAYSTKVAQRRIGDWSTALRRSGFEVSKPKNIPKSELEAEVEALVNELGHVPSSVELRKHAEHSLYVYTRRYGTWKNAVESMGFEYRGQPSGPEHPSWKGEGDISYGPNWQEQRTRAIKRDECQCQTPGCTVTRAEHRDRYGVDLNVHHITPVREFTDANGVLDYERANQLENLVTLCVGHHKKWEQFAPLQPDTR